MTVNEYRETACVTANPVEEPEIEIEGDDLQPSQNDSENLLGRILEETARGSQIHVTIGNLVRGYRRSDLKVSNDRGTARGRCRPDTRLVRSPYFGGRSNLGQDEIK
ncbi:hypothetical protein HHI36_006846 [Cryptolaemus montrouzieri]|uniref:Uncharacterized protein n=1 Tax=Cryptolaemus montrouzieri TaxID=559131 RepID=A0ABD2MNP5_9CUCU